MGICDEIEVATIGINKTTILTQYYKATIKFYNVKTCDATVKI